MVSAHASIFILLADGGWSCLQALLLVFLAAPTGLETCKASIIVGLTKQPSLGLHHAMLLTFRHELAAPPQVVYLLHNISENGLQGED
jgi:hypothetical protein